MTNNEDKLEQKKKKVLVENNAQAIFDHLTELSNLGGMHERRWLWELLQNAKDSIEENQTVSVEVDVRDNELIFKHNGNPFTDDEVIHLIYHGSTKKGATDKTGKFGTGFLTTHLLSRKVDVSGTLDVGRGFSFLLDRSGNNPKEIEMAMESSWHQFKESQTSYSDNNYTTIYKYELNEESKLIAKKAIQDLQNLLPFVLAFNTKLDCFTLIKGGTYQTFKQLTIESIDHSNITLVTVERSDQSGECSLQIMALAKENKTAVAIPLSITNELTLIKPIEWDIPRLFFDFPLFGTEDFSFPAIINSSDFIPKSERDGIYLGEKIRDDIKSNKQIIQIACQLYIDLVDCACSQHWGNLYLLASINDLPKKHWIDFNWLNKTLKGLQESIQNKAIVKTEKGEYVPPINALIPIDFPLTDLWEFAQPLFGSMIPLRSNLDSWFNVLKSWASLLDTSIEDFENALTFSKICETISNLRTLESLRTNLHIENSQEVINWINRFIDLLFSQSKKYLLENYALIPDQNGIMKKKTPSLFLDGGIDDTIKDISKEIGEDWRDRLVLLGIILDNSLFAVKTQDEILISTLQLLKQKSEHSNQASSIRKPAIDSLVWLVKNQRIDLLSDLPVLTKNIDSELNIPFAKLSSSSPLLVPTELWLTVPEEYTDLFPSEYILSSEYVGRLSDTDWQFIKQNRIVYSDPIYEEETELDYKDIFVVEDEQKAHRMDELTCSKIAFLDHPKDKRIYDRIRKSKIRAILFVKFILTIVIEKDHKWLQEETINCECGSPHSVRPSHWFYYVKSRKWVPSVNGGSEALSAQSLASLLVTEKSIISVLKEDKPALFLNKLGIGIGEILRNIVTGGDDTLKLEWDKVFGAILTSEVDPAKLLAEFQERERNREKVQVNQEIGKTIEKIFEATFSSDYFKSLGFKIERTGIGSDYELEHDFIDGDEEKILKLSASKSSTLVEIKSTVKPFCRMTTTQAKKAVDNAEIFCLCVVPLIDVEITEDIIRTNARFVTNIGDLLKPKVSEATSFQEIRNEAVSVIDDIEIDINEAQIKYRVNQVVWQDGKSYEEFVSYLRKK